MRSSTLRSGQLAEAAGVNHQTLRYYERRGLPADPDRTLGGHRLYPPEALTVLSRDVLRSAVAVGCDDLITCAHTPSCPIPFTDTPPADGCC
ncbi:MerR family DNA-binding transcriptional regulator [Saccharothrix sp. NRRL B-16314]|uniref:MerR family DNA-binding transcriptional regulator n=1 Tax=Saccharothrix sp. NRRL B-16314 TaxID=1463825 RepID=UPI000526EF87|nr:MerR family DNA-binding transcriptional regulator [Saccharothrix sp. NRRL B-16314]